MTPPPKCVEQENSTTPQRAEYLAPDTAVRPPPPSNDDLPYNHLHNAGPYIVMGVQGRDFALQAPIKPRCNGNTTRAKLRAIPIPPQHPRDGANTSHRDQSQGAHEILQSGGRTPRNRRHQRILVHYRANTAYKNPDNWDRLVPLIVHHNNKQKTRV